MGFIVATQSEEMLKVNDKQHSQQINTQHWKNPEPGILKVSSDGAYDQKDNFGGWVFIIRDSIGMLCKLEQVDY